MALIVNKVDGQRISTIATYEQMLSDDYLTNQDNIQTKFLTGQFFNYHGKNLTQNERVQLLNVSYSIPALISEKVAEYVGTPINPFNINLLQWVMAFVWGGYAIFKPRIIDGQMITEFVSPSNYILDDDGTERLVYPLYVLEGTQENEIIRKYIFEQVYTPGRIENQLYELEDMTSNPAKVNTPNNSLYVNNEIKGSRLPLDAIEATAGIPEIELTGLTVNPLVKVDNTYLNASQYGSSEIAKIQSIITSIELQLVNIQDQLLKHLQAKLAIPTSKLPVDKDGYVDVRALEVIGLEAGDPTPLYLTNTNPLIDKSFDLIEKMLRQISSITSIPAEFFGLKEQGGVESADAKGIRLSTFIKKVETIRKKFSIGMEQLFEIGKQWGVYGADEDFVLIWSDVFPKSQKEIAEELKIARESKLVSLKKAVMKYQGIDEEEALQEVNDILNENATNTPINEMDNTEVVGV